MFLVFIFMINATGNGGSSLKTRRHRGSSYVKPYVTRTGRVVSGHVRKSFSSHPNAYRNNARSKYYYQTHHIKNTKK